MPGYDHALPRPKKIPWGNAYSVDWSDQARATPGYPRFYDATVSNYHGHGVSVMNMKGIRLWDSRGRWIKQFKAQHPEFELPLPEGL